MSPMARKEAESGIYHVMSRGVNHCDVFLDRGDRLHFLGLLEELSDELDVSIGAWCLMDNHFHLLLTGGKDSISHMMRRLNASYALYFNKKHERDGHLFQGRFKSVPIESDGQYLTVLRYIHQNPERAGMSRTADYLWSSYHNYVRGKGLASTEFALSLFGGLSQFVEFHETLGKEDERGLLADDPVDEELIARASEILNGLNPRMIGRLGNRERREAVRALKNANLSTRQIERLSGISRSTVARM